MFFYMFLKGEVCTEIIRLSFNKTLYIPPPNDTSNNFLYTSSIDNSTDRSNTTNSADDDFWNNVEDIQIICGF